jgi:hypothetical protein
MHTMLNVTQLDRWSSPVCYVDASDVQQRCPQAASQGWQHAMQHAMQLRSSQQG